MGLLKTLQNRSRFFFIAVFLLGLSNAVWNGVLLILIDSSIHGTKLPFFSSYPWQAFVGITISSFLISKYFQQYIIRLTTGLAYDLGMSIFEKLRFASYQEFLKFGNEKIYSLNGDINTLSNLPGNFVGLFNAVILLLVGMFYLFQISPGGSTLIFIILGFLGYIFHLKNGRANYYMGQSRSLLDIYNRSINDLLLGFKEIKMSIRKNDNLYFNHLDKNRIAVKDLDIKTSDQFLNNELWGRYCWYIIIGLILFGLPAFFNLEKQNVTSFLVMLLFLMGPVGTIIAGLPFLSRTKISFEKLREYDERINGSKALKIKHGKIPEGYNNFSELRFENIKFSYANKFSVSIKSLSILRGELIFVVGGNGSGKSTFINILTGLVAPDSGSIFLNHQLITDEHYPYFRDQFSAIFSDNYIFAENYDNYGIFNNEAVKEYIKLFQLDGLVTIDSTKNKFETNLSKGQQKRLAMINSLLENKEIIVLDEWAADQDPHFRSYFYNVLLPKFKNEGKTIIVVSHDDYYYCCADRIIKLEQGRIVEDRRITSQK